MQSPDDPRRDPAARPQSPRGPHGEHPFGIVNACIVAVMLTVALGTVAIECGFYKAFDDSWFDLDGSALPSMLAMLGLGIPLANANVKTSPHVRTDGAR